MGEPKYGEEYVPNGFPWNVWKEEKDESLYDEGTATSIQATMAQQEQWGESISMLPCITFH